MPVHTAPQHLNDDVVSTHVTTAQAAGLLRQGVAHTATPDDPPAYQLRETARELDLALSPEQAEALIAKHGLPRARDVLRRRRAEQNAAGERHDQEQWLERRALRARERHERLHTKAARERRAARRARPLAQRVDLVLRELAALPAVSAGNIAPDISADRDHVLPAGGRTDAAYFTKAIELFVEAAETIVDRTRYADHIEDTDGRTDRILTRYMGVRLALVAAVERCSTDTISRLRISHGYAAGDGRPNEGRDDNAEAA